MISRAEKVGTPHIFATSAFAALAISAAWGTTEYGVSAVIPYGIFIAYTMYMIKVRNGFSDPAVISLFTFILYATLPLLAVDTPTATDYGFDLTGGFYIYSVASVAMIIATGLAFAFLPSREAKVSLEPPSLSFRTEAVLSGGLSVFLSMIFIAQHGTFDIGDPSSYLNRFSDQATPGAGILLLSAPLATATLCFTIVSTNRLAPVYGFCAIPYLMLFVALGQRKYLLLPFLFLAFRFFRIKSTLQLFGVLTAAAFAYVAFNYVGFIREESIGLADALDTKAVALFAADYGRYLNGEVYGLYVTASSAYAQALEASFVNNYLGAVLSLLPQFIFGQHYLMIEAQFAQLVVPDTADLNGGLGYSFFGEAYLIGGVAGIILATSAMTLILRSLFVAGGGLAFRGLRGVISLAMTYYAMWYLRLSFALFVHEVVIQIGVILFIFAAVRLLRRRNYRRLIHSWQSRENGWEPQDISTGGMP